MKTTWAGKRMNTKRGDPDQKPPVRGMRHTPEPHCQPTTAINRDISTVMSSVWLVIDRLLLVSTRHGQQDTVESAREVLQFFLKNPNKAIRRVDEWSEKETGDRREGIHPTPKAAITYYRTLDVFAR